MGNVTCQEQKPVQVGKMFWVDQLHGAARFPGDRPMLRSCGALLACTVCVDGADTGTGQAQRRTVTGAALAAHPHGNHGDNTQ